MVGLFNLFSGLTEVLKKGLRQLRPQGHSGDGAWKKYDDVDPSKGCKNSTRILEISVRQA